MKMTQLEEEGQEQHLSKTKNGFYLSVAQLQRQVVATPWKFVDPISQVGVTRGGHGKGPLGKA